MAGCCTIFRDRTRSRRASRASAGTAGIWRPAGGSTSCRRTAQPRGLVHAIERHNLDHLPGRQVGVRGTHAARGGAEDAARRDEPGGHGVLARQRHSVRVPRRCRHRRDGARGGRGRGHQRATWSSASTALWNAAAIAVPPRGRRQALSHQGPRLRGRRPAARGGRATTEFDIQQQMVAVVRGRRAGRGSAPNVSAQENAGQPALPAHRGAASRHPRRTNCCCIDLWGKLGRRRRRLRRHHMGGLHRPARCRTVRAGVRRRSPGARDAAVSLVQDAAARGGRGARLRAGSRGAAGHRARRATATQSCTAPGTASARRCTATARISTITRRTTSAG